MRPSRLSKYGSDHALNARFTLSTPLGFFMGLIRAKLGLTVEQGVALDLTCTLSERSQSSTTSSWLVFQVFASIFLQSTCNFPFFIITLIWFDLTMKIDISKFSYNKLSKIGYFWVISFNLSNLGCDLIESPLPSMIFIIEIIIICTQISRV